MVKRHIIELIDDIDQTPLGDSGRTHTFSLNGQSYEIDLSETNGRLLHDALSPFVKAGRRTGRKSTGSATGSRPRTQLRTDTDAIREWAKASGLKVSDRGRIATAVVEAYRNRAH